MERKARGTNFNFKQQCVCEWSQKANIFLDRPLWEINITGNTNFSVSDMGRQKYSESTLCLKNLVLLEKNNFATSREKKNSLRREAEKNIAPPPLS